MRLVEHQGPSSGGAYLGRLVRSLAVKDESTLALANGETDFPVNNFLS